MYGVEDASFLKHDNEVAMTANYGSSTMGYHQLLPILQ
jgi:hypothetical protein